MNFNTSKQFVSTSNMVTKCSEHVQLVMSLSTAIFPQPLQLNMLTHDLDVARYRRGKDEMKHKPQGGKMLYYTPPVTVNAKEEKWTHSSYTKILICILL
jgi:hypothetical protein